jgi:hypothetical protein
MAPLILRETFRLQGLIGVLFAIFGASTVVFSSKSEEVAVGASLILQTNQVITLLTCYSAAFTRVNHGIPDTTALHYLFRYIRRGHNYTDRHVTSIWSTKYHGRPRPGRNIW